MSKECKSPATSPDVDPRGIRGEDIHLSYILPLCWDMNDHRIESYTQLHLRDERPVLRPHVWQQIWRQRAVAVGGDATIRD